jgi:hypothetical protein
VAIDNRLLQVWFPKCSCPEGFAVFGNQKGFGKTNLCNYELENVNIHFDIDILETQEAMSKQICAFWHPKRQCQNKSVHFGIPRGHVKTNPCILETQEVISKKIWTL